MSAYGKVSYGGRRVNAYFGALLTPTTSTGTLPAYTGIGPQYISSSKASNNVNLERGYETDQRNFTGNADITVSSNSFLSVKAGHFYDDYADTGVPLTTPWYYERRAWPEVLVPVSVRGTASHPEHSRGSNRRPRHDEADLHAGRLQHELQRCWIPHAEVGRRHAAQRERRGSALSRWPSPNLVGFRGDEHGAGRRNETEAHTATTRLTTSGRSARRPLTSRISTCKTSGTSGNLTLNLGLRFEDEKIPAFRERDVAIQFGWGEKIAPRIGAAYNVKGDGRMKLFGSYGRYYDWTKYELARGTFGGDIWLTYYRPLDDPSIISSINLNNMPGRDLWGNAAGYQDHRVPSFGTDQLDPDMKPMSQDSFSGGVEYQLKPTVLLSVNYVHNNLVRTIEDVGQLIDGSEVYVYGNPGEGLTKQAFVSTRTSPFDVPRPKRQYDALQVSLNRRFSGNYFLGGSYVLSRLYGNYAGLANSDEIRTPGFSSFAVDQQQGAQSFRPGGNATRAFDLDEMMFDSHGNLNPTGRLATDRPHVLKMYGAYMTSFGTQIGLNQYVGSGTPITTYVRTINATEVFVEGRGERAGRRCLRRPTFCSRTKSGCVTPTTYGWS